MGVVMTNADGIAALTSWTLGAQAGSSQTVTASSPGLAGSPLTFTATALGGSMSSATSAIPQLRDALVSVGRIVSRVATAMLDGISLSPL